MKINLHNAEFVRSAVKREDFPKDGLPQLVFAGRSNVGKSSVINKLLNRNNFARVGQSPGKTTHINFFLIDKAVYFTDLPGYGYAKVSQAERDRWGKLMELYFGMPDMITAGILIVDARHKPTADDVTMAQWFKATGCPMIVAANKDDKLKASERVPNVERIRQVLELGPEVPVILFSAKSGKGKQELLDAAFGVLEND